MENIKQSIRILELGAFQGLGQTVSLVDYLVEACRFLFAWLMIVEVTLWSDAI